MSNFIFKFVARQRRRPIVHVPCQPGALAAPSALDPLSLPFLAASQTESIATAALVFHENSTSNFPSRRDAARRPDVVALRREERPIKITRKITLGRKGRKTRRVKTRDWLRLRRFRRVGSGRILSRRRFPAVTTTNSFLSDLSRRPIRFSSRQTHSLPALLGPYCCEN